MGNYINDLKKGEYNDTNYYEYWNQCRMLNYASEENIISLRKIIQEPIALTETNLKQRGLFNASLLLRAVAIENLIKARVLFMMKENGALLKYNSINEVINKEWGKASHNPIRLCEKYGIKLSDNEKELIENHLDHMLWAGRFPFPRNSDKIKSNQILGGSQKEDMNKLILRFADEMNLNLEEL